MARWKRKGESRPVYPGSNGRVEWTSNDEILENLDVSTAACSACGGPARVPEDVLAVLTGSSGPKPYVVCPDCQPAVMDRLRRLLDERGLLP